MSAIIHVMLDNKECIDFLVSEGFGQWVDEMPQLSLTAPQGRSIVSHRFAYHPEKRRCIWVLYYGAGCDPSDNGWRITRIDGVSCAMATVVHSALMAELEEQINK